MLHIRTTRLHNDREIGPASMNGMTFPAHVRNHGEVARYLLAMNLCQPETILSFAREGESLPPRQAAASVIAARKAHSVKSNAAREAYNLGLEKDQFRVVQTAEGWVYELGHRGYFSRKALEASAHAGELPAVPDFSAATHKRFRKLLAEVVALVEAGDIAALRAFEIKTVSTSPKTVARYRDLAVMTLEARASFRIAA